MVTPRREQNSKLAIKSDHMQLREIFLMHQYILSKPLVSLQNISVIQ
jgi:hypothetical protein